MIPKRRGRGTDPYTYLGRRGAVGLQHGFRHARRAAVLALCAATLAASALSLIGCSGGAEPRGGEGRSATITEEQYVNRMAALTVAVEEGLSGEAALARATELGAPDCSREELEQFARGLRQRPAEWVAVEERVENRVKELRDASPD